jgi:tyrosyl-tRNA synthetase
MSKGKELLEELRWRGLVAQTTDEKALIEQLDRPTTVYLGIDPTAPSIHCGNLVVLLVLKRMQQFGHTPIALVGGSTGLVGDPSGKSEERNFNDEDIVKEWVERIRKQVSKFLDFDSKTNSAIAVNNYDWTKEYSALRLLREIGKHFSVNQMLSKESVQNRIEASGISYTEFSYQVLQGLDYLELYRRHNCTLQIGGSDQWGNIIAGLDLIRKVEGGGAHALTSPLLVKSDGSKFGKTASGTVWLDPEMTSPYAFYQYWINTPDADVIGFLKVFTFLTKEEVADIEKASKENPGARVAQKRLARELTSLVHSLADSERVEFAAKALFGQAEISELDENTLVSSLKELPSTKITINEIPSWVDLLVATGIVDSKSAARRIVKEGGAYLNNQKVLDENFSPQKSDFLHGKVALLRKGKRDLAAVWIK